MHVGGDDVGQETRRQHLARRAEAEGAAAVADVEDHATGPRGDDLVAHASVGAHRRVGEGAEAVGEDVARPQAAHHLVARRRRRIEMGHHRQSGLLGDVEGDVERHDARIAASRLADAHLDAQHQVLVLQRHAHGLARIEQAHVGALAHHHRLGEGEDAGEGNVEVGQDADGRGFDHVLAEAVEVARPGAAGVDGRGDAAGAGQQLRLDAERGAAPIDVGVQVDQAGRDDLAANVTRVGAGEAVTDRRHLAAGEGDVGHLVDALRGVDDPAALENQIVHFTIHR